VEGDQVGRGGSSPLNAMDALAGERPSPFSRFPQVSCLPVLKITRGTKWCLAACWLYRTRYSLPELKHTTSIKAEEREEGKTEYREGNRTRRVW
jgi:hypothetical protein